MELIEIKTQVKGALHGTFINAFAKETRQSVGFSLEFL